MGIILSGGMYMAGGIIIVCLLWLAWRFRDKILRLMQPSYQQLLAQKAELDECVVDWRYSNGTYVPQHKRQRMFKELRDLSQKIRNHPDNPDNLPENSENP